MMVAASRSPSRLSTKVVTCERPAHGALNSGRKVTMSSAGRVLIRCTALPKASRLVGSDQCASSKIVSTGLERASTSTCEPSACNVCCLRRSGVKFKRRIPSIVRQRQHLSKECGILHRRRCQCEHRIELVELCLRLVVMHQSGRAFHLTDDRIQRAVGVLWRAEVPKACVRLGSEAFQQRRCEPRLADACFAGEQYHLTFVDLCFRPAPQQQFEFFFSPNKVR